MCIFGELVLFMENYIAQNYQQLKDKQILVAISGGVDSVVLAFVLHQLGFAITLAHVNFKLRKDESDEDQKFVAQFAQEYGLKLHIKPCETEKYAQEHKLSIQLAARKLRYDWFAELKSAHNYDCLATAHHLNDDAETFLINFIRGTGLEGLIGIKETPELIRPLLRFSKSEIVEYAQNHQLKWREDSTNASDKYLRNHIRHHVMPIFETLNPQFLNTFLQTKNNLMHVDDILKDALEHFVQKCVSFGENDALHLAIDAIKSYRNPAAMLYHFLKDYNFSLGNEHNCFLDAESGKQLFSPTHILLKDREKLILKAKKIRNNKDYYKINNSDKQIFEPIWLTLDVFEGRDLSTNQNEILVDADLLEFPLYIRKWQNGDHFQPFGMKGKKKLSKYFKDEKFSLFEKDETWILTNKNNQIIWIIGHRMDDRFKITNHTKKQIKIKLNQT